MHVLVFETICVYPFFCDFQKNRTIEVLDLSWNGLGSAGAEALKTALKINTTLKVLDLT
jgi:hypothetical protein